MLRKKISHDIAARLGKTQIVAIWIILNQIIQYNKKHMMKFV